MYAVPIAGSEMSRKQRDLQNLSRAGFTIWVGDDRDFVIVENVRLPPGYDRRTIPVLIELPPDYPLVPPGVGSDHIYVPGSLRYHGHKLEDIHEWTTPAFRTPGWNGWAWMCYDHIAWDPHRDDLIVFIETVRADLTNPEVK